MAQDPFVQKILNIEGTPDLTGIPALADGGTSVSLQGNYMIMGYEPRSREFGVMGILDPGFMTGAGQMYYVEEDDLVDWYIENSEEYGNPEVRALEDAFNAPTVEHPKKWGSNSKESRHLISMDVMDNYLNEMVDGYIEAALFTDEEQMQLLPGEEIDEQDKAQAKADCSAFLNKISESGMDVNLVTDEIDATEMGRDFWYTRNGHGTGFWDRELGDLGESLSNIARQFGETMLFPAGLPDEEVEEGIDQIYTSPDVLENWFDQPTVNHPKKWGSTRTITSMNDVLESVMYYLDNYNVEGTELNDNILGAIFALNKGDAQTAASHIRILIQIFGELENKLASAGGQVTSNSKESRHLTSMEPNEFDINPQAGDSVRLQNAPVELWLAADTEWNASLNGLFALDAAIGEDHWSISPLDEEAKTSLENTEEYKNYRIYGVNTYPQIAIRSDDLYQQLESIPQPELGTDQGPAKGNLQVEGNSAPYLNWETDWDRFDPEGSRSLIMADAKKAYDEIGYYIRQYSDQPEQLQEFIIHEFEELKRTCDEAVAVCVAPKKQGWNRPDMQSQASTKGYEHRFEDYKKELREKGKKQHHGEKESSVEMNRISMPDDHIIAAMTPEQLDRHLSAELLNQPSKTHGFNDQDQREEEEQPKPEENKPEGKEDKEKKSMYDELGLYRKPEPAKAMPADIPSQLQGPQKPKPTSSARLASGEVYSIPLDEFEFTYGNTPATAIGGTIEAEVYTEPGNSVPAPFGSGYVEEYGASKMVDGSTIRLYPEAIVIYDQSTDSYTGYGNPELLKNHDAQSLGEEIPPEALQDLNDHADSNQEIMDAIEWQANN